MREFMAVAKALADENRLRALMSLREGELCVCQIIRMLGLAPSTVSKHMTILLQAGLVEARKEGRWNYYRLAGDEASDAVRSALAWVRNSLEGDERIERDAARLEAIRRMPAKELSQCYKKLKVLFLCTGNACRSQMAEGWARQLKGGVIEAHSAGTEPHGLDARAVRVMAEAGVDISAQRSKRVAEVKDVGFDYVVTVCGRADERCPAFPGKTKIVHVGFDDPPALAAEAVTEEEALAPYRRVRDEIREFVEKLPDALTENTEQA